MKAISTFAFLFFQAIIFTINLYAQPILKAQNLLANKSSSQWSFEENRGQLADENGVVLKDVLYYGRDKGVAVYLRKNKISFVFSKTEPKDKKPAFSEAIGNIAFSVSPRFGKEIPEEVKIFTSRIDLEITDANPETQILAEEKISYYTNYYLAHTPEEGITNVPNYKKITYKNIYNNIDLVLLVKEKGMKYEFVVHPKGKISDIKLSWNGTKPDVLQNGGIKYASAFGEINESAPFSFNSEDGKEVKSAFRVKGNNVSFEVGNYDESKKLVIDPMLVWGTYYGGGEYNYGGRSYDFANSITTDPADGIYITGYTNSSSGVGTTGTHKPIYQDKGLYDAFITKFDNNGIRQWGTYYGGEKNEISHSITIDKNNYIFITGFTQSKNGIATIGAYQTISKSEGVYINEGSAFIAKFNNNGILQWGTFYGGDISGRKQGTWGKKIIIDGNSDVLVVGTTGPDTNLSSAGVHQTIHGGGTADGTGSGTEDAFVVKFNTYGVRQWGTYYGGTGSDFGFGISVDKDNNILIIGHTKSDTGIATQGAHQINYGGGYFDAFIAKFNVRGVRQWGTYYGGNGYDYGNDIITNSFGENYITGWTNSSEGIATLGTYQPNLSVNGSADGFLAKINSNGVKLWGSYFGGIGYEISYRLTADEFDNIYIAGSTSSALNISDTGVYQEINGGGYDAFIAKFNNKGLKIWATYYGGSEEDRAYDINYRNNSLYITGDSRSINGIATKNAHQINYGGGYNDAFIAKFNNLPPNVGILSIYPPTGNTCGGIYEVQARIKNYSSRIQLDNVKIGWSVNGKSQKNYNWQGTLNPGDTSSIINIGSAYFKGRNNILKVWTFDPNGGDDIDYSNDTLTKTINFLPTPEAKTGNDTFICTGETANIGAAAVAGNIYKWTSSPPGFVSMQSKITVTSATTTTYYLKETDTTSGCTKEDSITITVYPYPDPIIIGDTSICGKNTAIFQAANNPGSTYSWEAEGGSIISGQSTNSITIKIDKNTKTGKVKLTETNAGKCAASKELAYNYKYSPLSDLSPDIFICEGQSKLLKIDSAGDKTYYRWYPDETDTVHFITVRKEKNYYVLVRDNICNNELREEIHIPSKCLTYLIIYPNPAQQYITIKYSLSERVNLKLSLYDRLGKEVIKIADGFYEQGVYEYKIDATQHNLSAAIYAVRMLSGNEALVKQFILLK